MKVYLAAPWVERDRLAGIAAAFEAEGHTITERWWEHEDVPGYPNHTTPAEDAELANQGIKDFMGVLMADAMVLVNSCKSEGKAVETGIALTKGMPVIVVGVKSNIFHWMLPEEHVVATVEDALEVLR